jgi:threonine/homoserine/homoserine lactone efflux protein
MLDSGRFALFLAAAVLLAVTPGPGILYVLARSLASGRREGIQASAGTFVGGLVNVVGAALGVSAVLAASAVAFAIVKYAGAAYLVYLGIPMIHSRNADPDVESALGPLRSAFTQGAVTEILNPKTALFFLSFIPQFITPEHGYVFVQFVLLGSTSVLLNTSADLVVVMFAGPLGHRLKSSFRFRRRQRTVCGLGMIGLGTWVAVADGK